MSTKVIEKFIRSIKAEKIAIPYCAAQNLLKLKSPIYYTAGVCGWNYDSYIIDGVIISTGYRHVPGESVSRDIIKYYDDIARGIFERIDLTYDDTEKLINELIDRFISEITSA